MTSKLPLSNIADVMTALRGLISVEPKFAMTHLFSTHILHMMIEFFDSPYV